MIYCIGIRAKEGAVLNKVIYITSSVDETEMAGAMLAKTLTEKDPALRFIMLRGSLGAGKTAFTRGVASVISPGSRVKSPSYTIVNEYRLGAVPLFHFDLYRLGEGAGLEGIGFDEYVESGHCIIEWSEYLDDAPQDAITVTITDVGTGRRKIEIVYP